MRRCAMCGYGTELEWHDHGICDECRRYLDRAFWEFEIDTDIPDPATDAYITQRPGASRGPWAPKNHPPKENTTMRTEIQRQAEFMGYEISPADIEGIIDTKFHLIVTNNTRMIRAAIRAWFAE